MLYLNLNALPSFRRQEMSQQSDGLGESWLSQNKQLVDLQSGVGLAGYTSALEKAIMESRAKKSKSSAKNFVLPPPPPQAPGFFP